MKPTTPLWLVNKYRKALLFRIVPIAKTQMGDFTFYYLRKEGPPHNPMQFRSRGIEFHAQIQRLHGELALDIGANIGSYTLPLARRFQRVVAFEPSSTHCRILKSNIDSNNLSNVKIEQIAIDENKGIAPLFLRDGGATSLNPFHYGLKYESLTKVKVARLDDYLSDCGRLDFVKIDAEGRELGILKGGVQSLGKLRPMLAVEVHEAITRSNGECSCEVCHIVRGLGYETKTIGESGGAIRPVHWVWGAPLS